MPRGPTYLQGLFIFLHVISARFPAFPSVSQRLITDGCAVGAMRCSDIALIECTAGRDRIVSASETAMG